MIPKNNFMATDLENPDDINIQFDLVSLEVAEHIHNENLEKFSQKREVKKQNTN